MSDDDQDEVSKAQAALNQALSATANSLTPGTCCDKAVEGLRSQIISLLSCDACQDMSFQVENVRVSGSLYRGVAQALRNPNHTMHVSIVPDLKSNNGKDEAGEYDPAA